MFTIIAFLQNRLITFQDKHRLYVSFIRSQHAYLFSLRYKLHFKLWEFKKKFSINLSCTNLNN